MPNSDGGWWWFKLLPADGMGLAGDSPARDEGRPAPVGGKSGVR